MVDLAELVPPMPGRILGGPGAWRGAEMARRGDWVHHLAPREVGEIAAAVAAHGASGRSAQEITAATFPLPTLGPRLKAFSAEILRGRGFVLLRGLPVERWSVPETATAYYGLGTHLGRVLSQNVRGHLLDHVRDTGQSLADPNVRAYQTALRMDYHTDMACDVVGLLCRRTAREGGESFICGATTLHDEVWRRDPDLCAELFRPFWFDRRAEIPPGKQPYFPIPLFNWYQGTFSLVYSPLYIASAQARFPELPRLTPRQRAALDLLETVAHDPAIYLAMEFRPGDVQLLNNFTVLHARTAFADWPEPARRRHLLRLWLCVPDGLPIPPCFAERYGTVTSGDRGGISRPGVAPNIPLAAD
ncbi:MAG: TauD/TfdA family dioxygenase [Alphaproteobacteria bacterium]|nr:TauD/TfdA family dioxygenase [Alphaproteobacteria bacterium]